MASAELVCAACGQLAVDGFAGCAIHAVVCGACASMTFPACPVWGCPQRDCLWPSHGPPSHAALVECTSCLTRVPPHHLEYGCPAHGKLQAVSTSRVMVRLKGIVAGGRPVVLSQGQRAAELVRVSALAGKWTTTPPEVDLVRSGPFPVALSTVLEVPGAVAVAVVQHALVVVYSLVNCWLHDDATNTTHLLLRGEPPGRRLGGTASAQPIRHISFSSSPPSSTTSPKEAAPNTPEETSSNSPPTLCAWLQATATPQLAAETARRGLVTAPDQMRRTPGAYLPWLQAWQNTLLPGRTEAINHAGPPLPASPPWVGVHVAARTTISLRTTSLSSKPTTSSMFACMATTPAGSIVLPGRVPPADVVCCVCGITFPSIAEWTRSCATPPNTTAAIVPVSSPQPLPSMPLLCWEARPAARRARRFRVTLLPSVSDAALRQALASLLMHNKMVVLVPAQRRVAPPVPRDAIMLCTDGAFRRLPDVWVTHDTNEGIPHTNDAWAVGVLHELQQANLGHAPDAHARAILASDNPLALARATQNHNTYTIPAVPPSTVPFVAVWGASSSLADLLTQFFR
jgi:hypothetical protein